MRADVRRQIEPRDHGIFEISLGGVLGSVKQFVAVEDFDYAAVSRAVRCVHAIALGAGGHHAVHVAGRSSRRTGLLSWQAEVTDEHRLGRIAQIVDLAHSLGAPAGLSRDKKSDSGVALPPTLVSVAQPVEDDIHARGLCRIGHVPHFMSGGPRRPQHIEFVFVGSWQLGPITNPHHLCAARFTGPGRARVAGNMSQVLGLLRIGDVDERRSVVLDFSR